MQLLNAEEVDTGNLFEGLEYYVVYFQFAAIPSMELTTSLGFAFMSFLKDLTI